MTQFKIESKQKKSTLLILILGGVACMLVCGFLIKNALSDDYLDLIYLLLGLLFGIFGITCFIGLYLADNLIIENRKLKIYAQTGRLKNEILIDNIENYIEVEKESRYTKWKDLTIYTKNSNYTISSYACPNYHQLRKVLTKGKKKNFYAEKIMYYKTHRRYGAGFLIFGTIFMLVFGNIFMQKDLDIRQNQLIQIQGTVSNNIKIKRSGKRNGDRSIEIILMEYPKFQFKIGGYGFSATKISDLIHNIQKGDQIKIEVLEEQFQKKIAKDLPMTFLDKNINYRSISVYGLNDNEETYFDLQKFNHNRKADRNSWALYVFLSFGFFLIGYGFYLLLKNEKPIGNES